MIAQVRVVRIFNTYGPRMALDDGRVVSNFVAQALTNQDLTVYGDGQQTRSFQYVSDLIRGMTAVSAPGFCSSAAKCASVVFACCFMHHLVNSTAFHSGLEHCLPNKTHYQKLCQHF